MEKIINNSDPLLHVAPCGMDCRFCMAYLREKNPCAGCRMDDPNKPKTRLICKIKTCGNLVRGEFEFCYECNEFPCARLTHMDKRYRTKYGTSVIENLGSIQAVGLEQFMESENRRWTCPICSGVMSIHKPSCPSCGYVWRKDL